MKKFSLKPLGDSCIKKLCKSWFFIGLIMSFCLSACSDDDDNNAVTPTFPEKQNIVCNGESTTEFTFEANTNWSLTSSAIWCKFQKDGEDEFIVSGKAGKQTITIVVTNEDRKVGKESVAKLELTMGGQKIVIGEITRPVEDYVLKIYDEEGNEIQELEAGYEKFIKFKVKANFRFAATNLPGWVTLEGGSLVGVPNQEVRGGLQIIKDENREKYPVVASDANVITFADESGKAFSTFKVSYKGMTPGVMQLTTPSSNKYDWVVSLDGKTFAKSEAELTGGGSTTTNFKNHIPFTVKTLNDDFEIVFLEKGAFNNTLYLMDPDNKWMHCEREKGNVSLFVEGASQERVGYVLVFSRNEYESIKNDLENTILEEGGEDIAHKYQNNNLLIQFTQKEVKASTEKKAFTITYYDINANENIEVTCTKATHDYEYGIDDVYVMKQPDSGGYALTIDPDMSGEFGTDWEVQVFSGDDNLTKDYLEPGDKTFTISNNKTLTKDLAICIKQNYMNVKVLIITPND